MGKMEKGFESSATYLNKVTGNSQEKGDNKKADFWGYVLVVVILAFALIGISTTVFNMCGFSMVHDSRIMPKVEKKAKVVVTPTEVNPTEEQKSKYKKVEEIVEAKELLREENQEKTRKLAEEAAKDDGK